MRRYIMLRLVPVLLLVLCAFAATACGGDNATASPRTVGPAGASTAPAAPAGENWAVNGQISGTAVMTKVTCNVVAGSYQVNVSGKLQNADFAVAPVFSTTAAGTLTYGTDAGLLLIEVKYGAGQSFYHWNDGSGATGSGTLTVGTKGSGSMQVTVPVSLNSPGGAVSPITVAGKWTCP